MLPERQALPELYDAFQVLLDNLHEPEVWPAVFIPMGAGAACRRWVMGWILRACAATGSNDGLAYVSPRSGRAVSASAGEPYKDKLYRLPRFLIGGKGW